VSRQGSGIRRFVIFLVDGVSSSTFDEALASGKLPNLRRYVQEGSYHNNVVASFPTVTGPAHVPLFSGITPASIDIIGHNQFVRRENLFENYLLYYKQFEKRFGDRPTIYDHFKNSAALSEPFRFGATVYRKNLFSLADWARIRGPANWYVLRTVRHEYRRGRDLIIAWLHETDGLAHMSPRHSQVTSSLMGIDRFVGKFEKEIDDETALLFVSDHGMERTDGKPFSLSKALVQNGVGRKKFKLFLDGGGFAQIYFAKNDSFTEQLSEEQLGKLPQQLAQYDAVDLVIHRRAQGDQRSAVITSKKGRAVIKKNEKRCYEYRVEFGRDPLGIVTDQSVSTVFEGGQDAARCLALSGASNYPDGQYQVCELLNAPSSGDLIVTSAPRKGFNTLTRFGVHGGLNRTQAVTFLLSNKKLTGIEGECLRTADVFNIILANRADLSTASEAVLD
jgi:hypothetical protein